MFVPKIAHRRSSLIASEGNINRAVKFFITLARKWSWSSPQFINIAATSSIPSFSLPLTHNPRVILIVIPVLQQTLGLRQDPQFEIMCLMWLSPSDPNINLLINYNPCLWFYGHRSSVCLRSWSFCYESVFSMKKKAKKLHLSSGHQLDHHQAATSTSDLSANI